MNRTVMVLATLLVALAARPATAQAIGNYNPPGNPYAQPAVSPYLNLLPRSNNNPGINYYGLVVPQMDAQRYIQQQEIQALQNPATTTGTTTPGLLVVTGHTTRFLTYNQYFLTQGGPGVGIGGIGRVGLAAEGAGLPLTGGVAPGALPLTPGIIR